MKYALALLLLPSFVFGANLPPSAKQDIYEDFSGGLNTQKASHKLPKNQSPALENVLIDDKPGSMVTRGGMAVAASNITAGGYVFQKINFQKEFIDDSGNHGLFIADSSAVAYTADLQNWTLVKATLTPTALLSADQGRGYMLFTNGVDPVFISSGLTAIALDGTNGRPNVPRGKFTAFYQERFFLFNTTVNPSALQWMEQSSTAGYVIPITDPNAWPITNQLYIGESDGAPGSGLDVFSGQLRMHKSNKSIYTLFGIDESNYNAQPTNANSGTASNRSIVQLDNLEYFFEKEGVRAFNGQDSVRISDDIFPDIEAIASNLTNVVTVTWDTDPDFSRGSPYNSTVTGSGFLTVIGTVQVNSLSATPGTDGITIGIGGSTTTAFQNVSTSAVPSPGINFSIALTSGALHGKRDGVCSDPNFMRLTLFNSRTGQMVQSSTFAYTDSTIRRVSFTIPGLNLTADDVRNSRIKIKADITQNSDCNFEISSFTVPNLGGKSGSVYFGSTNTASFTTEIVTATAISIWDVLDAESNTGGGTINYFVKAATSIVQIQSEPYVSVMAGNVIPFSSSRTFVQVMATMSAVNVDVTTNVYIDSLVIKWNQGGAADTSPAGIEWKKRYFLLVSTQPSGTNSIIYVKSRITNSNPNAWTKFTFSNDYFKSIGKFNGNLYLGSGSEGTLYRFDYGTNDDNSPIAWFYETPDTDMGIKYREKIQSEYLFDVNSLSGANLTFGTSINGGSFTNRSISLNGSGRILKVLKHNVGSGVARSGFFFRYRLSNSIIDQPITFHGFTVVYDETDIRPGP